MLISVKSRSSSIYFLEYNITKFGPILGDHTILLLPPTFEVPEILLPTSCATSKKKKKRKNSASQIILGYKSNYKRK